MRAAVVLFFLGFLVAQQKEPAWTAEEKVVVQRLNLRALNDERRAVVTRELALEIRKLPSGANKLQLASTLADLATEGDFGRDTLQEVTSTLAGALREHSVNEMGTPHVQLAQLVHYEHMKADLSDPLLVKAKQKLESDDAARAGVSFELNDLAGKTWRLADLKGRVVLLNFWATWCGPCRKEMPDLESLYRRFAEQGLVVLAITDDEVDKVKSYVGQKGYTFPVLLDPGRKTGKAYRFEMIPKSFVYDREGSLVAQAMDVRNQGQFSGMLEKAGLK